jgi:hypothetical protein
MKGTLNQLGQQMIQSFQKLSPAQQEQARKVMYGKTTGQPVRPN